MPFYTHCFDCSIRIFGQKTDILCYQQLRLRFVQRSTCYIVEMNPVGISSAAETLGEVTCYRNWCPTYLAG